MAQENNSNIERKTGTWQERATNKGYKIISFSEILNLLPLLKDSILRDGLIREEYYSYVEKELKNKYGNEILNNLIVEKVKGKYYISDPFVGSFTQMNKIIDEDSLFTPQDKNWGGAQWSTLIEKFPDLVENITNPKLIEKEEPVEILSTNSEEKKENEEEIQKEIDALRKEEEELEKELEELGIAIDLVKKEIEELPDEEIKTKEGEPTRYLTFNRDSIYKEITASEEPTHFYESDYNDVDKTSKINIADEFNVKSSAARSRLTPFFDVEGHYGYVNQIEPAVIEWRDWDKNGVITALVTKLGKIKLTEDPSNIDFQAIADALDKNKKEKQEEETNNQKKFIKPKETFKKGDIYEYYEDDMHKYLIPNDFILNKEPDGEYTNILRTYFDVPDSLDSKATRYEIVEPTIFRKDSDFSISSIIKKGKIKLV